MKRLLILVLLSSLLLSAASCNLTGTDSETTAESAESTETVSPETTSPVTDAETTGAETGDETTAADETTGADSTIIDPIPEQPMDLLNTDLTPYITLGAYKNVAVSAKEIGYRITLHNSMLANEAYYTKVTEGDRTVKEGDIINVDYKGFLDGVAFEGGEAADQVITVYEDGSYIPGFAGGFVGVKVGGSSSFLVTFPEDYHEASLAGKEVTFEFTVNYICEFAELTDEIANALSSGGYPTAEAYETYQRNLLVQSALWGAIVDGATIVAYPEEQVLYYYGQLRDYYAYYAQYYGMTYEAFLTYLGTTDAEVYESAKVYVNEDLVYYAILQAESITLTDDDLGRLENYIRLYKEQYGYTDEQIEANMESIKENMLYDKVQELLIEWADIRWE